jgi:hypothetical protein
VVTPKLSRRNKASNHKFALLLSKALGCKRAGTEKDPLPIPARPCQACQSNRLGGNRLLA